MNTVAEEILRFWFGTSDVHATVEKREVWFKSTPEFDAELIEKFSQVHERAAQGELDHLEDNPRDCVALVIALDQFPRNIYRRTAKAFQSDSKARLIAHQALARGFDMEISVEARKFFYLPLIHSELLSDQEVAVEKYQVFDDEMSLKSALGHRDAIRRFGRFPHRNEAMGRTNTPEEETYLETPPTWGMTAAEAAQLEANTRDPSAQR
jgi:uncharacterized protein (DUF924 family)